jgi:two-component system, LuxR family, sensor histidine kinase DctS
MGAVVASEAERAAEPIRDLPLPTPDPGLAARSSRAVGLVAILAIGLVLLSLGALIWLLGRDEREQQRITLINDALWAEQSLRFAIQSDRDDLARMASEIRGGLPLSALKTRIESLLRNSPEIESIVLFGADGGIRLSVPGGLAPPQISASVEQRFLALSSGQTIFSAVTESAPGFHGFDIAIPIYRDLIQDSVLLARFSLGNLLANHVPWWAGQKYQIAFTDSGGAILASRTPVTPGADALSHTIAFDPPGKGLTVTVTRLDSRTRLASRALIAAIVGFSILAIASLVAMRAHMRRRAQAERALSAEHAFRKAMEDSITIGMRARDLKGRVIYVNQAFCRMVGYGAEELIGRDPPMPYWAPEEMERTQQIHQDVLDGNAPPEGFEIRFQRKNGEKFDGLIYEAPLIDANGRHCGWMGSFLDITDRKRIEEIGRRQNDKLAQTSRLVTMGEMASSLAHELNQPLLAISSYAAGSLHRLNEGTITSEELAEVLAKLNSQAQRAGQIIRRIRDFVRKSEPKFATVDLAGLLREVTDFVAPEMRKHGVRFEQVDWPTDLAVTGDRILLEQALLNLLRNATEAMAGVEASKRRISVAISTASAEATVSVMDKGPGLSPEAQQDLFVPFSTTKAEGMGMGLNICRTIIELHRGKLWYEDRPGGGAIFRFSLPIASGNAPAIASK